MNAKHQGGWAFSVGENLDTFWRMTAHFRSGAYLEAQRDLHENLVVDEPPGLPQGGAWHGRDASERIKRLVTNLWDREAGPLGVWDCGDVVMAYREITWTSKQTGKSVVSPQLEMYEFQEGQIIRTTVYIKDVVGVLDTLEP